MKQPPHNAPGEGLHEPASSPEIYDEKEQLRPVFDLEQMEPARVVTLVAALGVASDAEADAEMENVQPRAEYFGATELFSNLEADIARLPQYNLKKAVDLYFSLATSDLKYPQAVVASQMGKLLQAVPKDDADTRRYVVDLWLALLRTGDDLVTECADDAIYEAAKSDWIDESTAQFLLSYVSED